MGVREGLLCLLARGDSHGYGLKLELESTTGHTWRLNIGQVYTTLQRLERDGLVRSKEADDDGRVVYSITDEGRAVAQAWMTTAVDLPVADRDEISLKILMAVRSGVADPRRVVERQRGATMGLLQDYVNLKAADDGGDLAWLLHLDRLIYSAEAELRWLDRVEDRLDALDAPSPALSRKQTREVVG